MTTIDIEGVKITPEAHAMLKDFQIYPEAFISIIDSSEDILLSDDDERNPAYVLRVLKELRYLKSNLERLRVPNKFEDE